MHWATWITHVYLRALQGKSDDNEATHALTTIPWRGNGTFKIPRKWPLEGHVTIAFWVWWRKVYWRSWDTIGMGTATKVHLLSDIIICRITVVKHDDFYVHFCTRYFANKLNLNCHPHMSCPFAILPAVYEWKFMERTYQQSCEFSMKTSNCGLVTPYGDIDLDQHWFRRGLLLDSAIPFQPMLNYRQRGPSTFTGGQYHRHSSKYHYYKVCENYLFENTVKSPLTNELIEVRQFPSYM